MKEEAAILPGALKIACGAQTIDLLVSCALLYEFPPHTPKSAGSECVLSTMILLLLAISSWKRSIGARRVCVALVGARAGLTGLTIVWEVAYQPLIAGFAAVPFLLAIITIWALDTSETRQYFAV